MSGGAQGGPSSLRDLSARLATPLPHRTRFLRELAFDLDALADRLEASGLGGDEARMRAAEALLPHGPALAELQRIHRPPYRRATGRLDAAHLLRWERGAAAAAGTALLWITSGALLRADLLTDASPFLWPVIVLGSATLLAALVKWFGLWIKHDHARPRRGLGAILGLAATTLGLGAGGFLTDLLRLAARLEASPELAATLVYPWLIRDAALLAIALIFALAGGVCWLVASLWIAFNEDAHERALLYDPLLGRKGS